MNVKLSKYNLKNITEIVFCDFLTLIILKNSFDNLNYYKNYVNSVDSNATYYMAEKIWNYHNYENTIKDKNNSELFSKHLSFTKEKYHSYMNKLKHDNNNFLNNLEKDLYITNSGYKNVKILINHFEELDEYQKSLAITRLCYFYNTYYKDSELYHKLKILAAKEKYFIHDSCNPELKTCGTDKNKNKNNFLTKLLWIGAAVAHGAYKGLKK